MPLATGTSESPDLIGIGFEIQVVAQSDQGDHDPHLLGELATQRTDAFEYRVALAWVDEGNQPHTDMDRDTIHIKQVFDGLLVRFLAGGRLGLGRFLLVTRGYASDGGRRACQKQELNLGHSGHQGHRGDDERGDRQRLTGFEELLGDILADAVVRRDLRDEEARTDGNHQRGDLTDQTVTDREDRVCLQGCADRHATGVAHRDATDDIHGGDDQTRLGVAADELAGTVHGPVEFAFLDDLASPFVRLPLGDRAGIEVGIDGHLLAGHGVEDEASRDLTDTLGTLGDDDELDDDENQEDDQTDDETAAGDETAEGVDDFACVALEEDQTCGGDVEREAKQGNEEQQ